MGRQWQPVSAFPKRTMIRDYVGERKDPGITYSLSQIILLFRVPQFVLRRAIHDSDRLEVREQNKPPRWEKELEGIENARC